MSAMNIDRSLDDMVKDARKKNGVTRSRRRKNNQSKPGSANPAGKDVEMGDIGLGAAGMSKRRSRKKRGGSLSGTDIAMAAADAAAASASAGGGAAARPSNKWPHDKFRNNQGSGAGGQQKDPSTSVTGFKVVVANLDRKVTSLDISDLFSQVGAVTRAEVIVDATGISTGTAELLFRNRNNALTAIQQYNNVPLNGRAMKLSLSTAKSGAVNVPGSNGNPLDRPLGGAGAGKKQKKRKDKKGKAARNSMTF